MIRKKLLSDAKLLDQRTILVKIRLLEIIQKASSLTDHLQKAAGAVVVLRVLLDVVGQFTDALRQDGDLNFRLAGVALKAAVLVDDGCLLFF